MSVGRAGLARHVLAKQKPFVIASTAAVAIAMLMAPMSANSAQFVWNMTSSAPTGVYRIDRSSWEVGDRVAVRPSQGLAADLNGRGILAEGKLLIKRVVAAGGETVCRRGDKVSINSRVAATALTAASDGVLLPVWQGCATLTDDQVFLLGDTANSYDGRYFGVTSAHDVIGRALLVVPFR